MVVVVGGRVVAAWMGSEPVTAPAVLVGKADAPATEVVDGSSPRVTKYTARPRTNPAATIMITRPALSFTESSSYVGGAHSASPVRTGCPCVSMYAGIKQESMVPSGATTALATAVVALGTELWGQTKFPNDQKTAALPTISSGCIRWGW